MVSTVHDIPGTHVALVPLKGHAAATTTEVTVVWVAPFAAKVSAVRVIWNAAITGADSNTTHINVQNRGTAGTGTTELGAVDYVNGTDAALGATIDLYTPASPLAVAAGTKIAIQHEKVGNGLLIPDGLVIVEYEGN